MVRPADNSKPQCIEVEQPQPTSWFCSDPATRKCTKQVTATGKQQGCAAQLGEPSGTGSEADCVKTCYNPIKGHCVGDVGYCHNLPSDKVMFKGMTCGCAAINEGWYNWGNNVVGCAASHGMFPGGSNTKVSCLTGTGGVIPYGSWIPGGQATCK